MERPVKQQQKPASSSGLHAITVLFFFVLTDHTVQKPSESIPSEYRNLNQSSLLESEVNGSYIAD